MSWDAVAAIGELVGAAAVVGSLVYLSIQIRHNSRQVEEQIRALNADSLTAIENVFSRFRHSLIANPQVASLWRRTLESFDSLNDDEKSQANVMMQEYCWAWQDTITRLTRGDYEREGIEPYLKNLIYVISHPGARQWWLEGKREYSDGFVKLVEQGLAAEQLSDRARPTTSPV